MDLFPVTFRTEEPEKNNQFGWISVSADERPCNYKQYPVTIEKPDGSREVYTATPMPDREDKNNVNWTVGREGRVVAWYKIQGPYQG